jgi:hypothetical protein
MNRKSFWLVILSLTSTIVLVFGQGNFQPGYVIADNGDTLRGFIDYRHLSGNPEQIAFKNTPVSEVVIHRAEDIQGYHVNNETYVSATIQHDLNPTKIDELSYSPVPKYEQLTTFLMVLYQGPKSLYFHRDHDGRTGLYIKGEQGEFLLLKYYRYRVEGGQVVTNMLYKDQLQAYFNDCPEVKKKIKLLTYSEISLEKLFKTYYTSCSNDKVMAYVRKKPGFEFGIVGGVSATTLRFEGDTKLDPLQFDPSLRPAIGLSLNITAPTPGRRFSVYNELILNNYMFQESKLTPLIGGTQVSTDLRMGATHVKLTNMFRYVLITGKMGVFVNAGMSHSNPEQK